MWRRTFDLLAACLGLLVLGPLLLAVAVLIRLEDGGPALFTQVRLGKDRRPFRIYKFRSMQDGRVTRPGAWLRTTGIDELAQLVNLLRGEMSLIGPRPLTPADVRRLGWDDDGHALRWCVRPGIAGLAQLYAGRGARSSWFLDCRYVERRTGRMDLVIVLFTAAMCLVGKRPVRGWLRRRWRPRMAALRQRRSPGRAAPGPVLLPLMRGQVLENVGRDVL